MKRLALVLALSTALAGPAKAQTTWLQCAVSTPCKLWYGTATTNSSGQWSVTFPGGTFSTVPMVLPQALSADTTIANSARASLTAQSAAGASGVVVIPAAIVVGGMPVKAAGAGITVDVVRGISRSTIALGRWPRP